ncbi:MAG: type II toxin-antitoxin system RelE/ParE family toxin [Nitrospirae bacterium]|nr:type II toxin-antitoxin system RelE/ParE family toxin [Nitrospirota bacterium]
MYVLLAKPTVEKDLRSVHPEDLAVLNHKIKSLAAEPRQHQTEKLKGVDGYRLRVGKYRIIYNIDDQSKTVTIHRVLYRKEAYR